MKYLLAVTLLLCGCAHRPETTSISSYPQGRQDAEFNRFVARYLDGHLAWRPQLGTTLGLHEYDGRITDLSRASLNAERARLQEAIRALAGFNPARLSPRAGYDYHILKAAIQDELFAFQEMEIYTKNPMTYAGAIDVNIYIKRNFAPLPERVRSIIAIERQTPAIVAAAKQNLEARLAKPFVETAMEVANGSASFLSKDLVEALRDFSDPALQQEFKAVNDAAVTALRGYAEYLKTEKLPQAHTNYALGREKFQQMLLTGEMIDRTPEQILELGLRELKREQEIFAKTARQIDPAKPPIEVFKEIQRDHPTPEGLIPDTRKNLEAIRQFVIDRKIVTLPSDVRARVEETPPFARATSFASMDTPGPFETKATEAYYYVTPTEANWPEKQKEEWLTAFNYYTTDIVSIHEAYPGHYTQFLSLNASPASRMEKIFSSYAFTEGWAHYTEQLLLDEGFGKSEADPLRGAKYRLAQSDEALLRLCRLCVSVQMHCQGMSVEEATRFFQNNCYYEEKTARQEAIRGTFDPKYLYYTLGKLQILKLREDYQRQEGPSFTLQRFHDEMLRHGMPPIRLLREVLLKDSREWNKIF